MPILALFTSGPEVMSVARCRCGATRCPVPSPSVQACSAAAVQGSTEAETRRHDHGVPAGPCSSWRLSGPSTRTVGRADLHPAELPADSACVPTFHHNRQTPQTATRQLDFVFASKFIADPSRAPSQGDRPLAIRITKVCPADGG